MMEFAAEHFVAQGDRVVVLGRCAWRYKKTGKVVWTLKANSWRFTDGKAVEFSSSTTPPRCMRRWRRAESRRNERFRGRRDRRDRAAAAQAAARRGSCRHRHHAVAVEGSRRSRRSARAAWWSMCSTPMRLRRAVAAAKPDVVIHQLTDLPDVIDPASARPWERRTRACGSRARAT